MSESLSQYVEGRLDVAYVRSSAAFIAGALRSSRPVGLAFQPGDGTRYDLIFVPVLALDLAPPRIAPLSCHTCRGHLDARAECPDCKGTGRGEPEAWDAKPSLGVSWEAGTALVTWFGHPSMGGDFRSGGFHGAYLGDVFDCGAASGEALAFLFNEIAAAFVRPLKGI